jgi:adenosyl cobinamide kinase/adenosyl cobinamide phosphate guanylyltransferase
MTRKGKSITAEQAAKELAGDPAYLANRAEMEQKRQAEVAQNYADMAPILKELAESGIVIIHSRN